MNKEFLQEIKDILFLQKEQLLEKSNQISDIDMDGDETDEIQANLLLELAKKLSSRDILKLNKINEALSKLNNNTYGVCEECEEDIPEKRLMANPCFSTCVLCAEQKEIENLKRRI